jgi:c-di-GMP-related signal transduction protein
MANKALVGGVGQPAFINFTRDTLVQGYASILPKEAIVVEVLESVEPDDEVIAACRALKRDGYSVALDDFRYRPELEPLLECAEIVKVDFLAADIAEQKQLAQALARRGIKLLAEKVETVDDFVRAGSVGYAYFQGYFFAKPNIVSRRDVPGFKLSYLTLLKEINRPDLDLVQVEEIIKREVSLSYKLLRYINSAAFSLRSRVVDVRQALLLLGQSGVRTWASVIVLSDLGQDKPSELVTLSVMRAKLCESIADRVGLTSRRQDVFLMGLFSLMDVLVGRPLDELLAELPLAEDVEQALLGGGGAVAPIFRLATAYETGDWARASGLAASLGLDESVLPGIYREAATWSDSSARLGDAV